LEQTLLRYGVTDLTEEQSKSLQTLTKQTAGMPAINEKNQKK
jgi:hypothetical protein